MKNRILLGVVLLMVLVPVSMVVMRPESAPAVTAQQASDELSLITSTPEEGFALAVRLSRLGVTETQPDREVLHALRPEYANDPDALIAASQVAAIHFQTIAAANDYWR